MKKYKNKNGLSIIETLIVVTVFALLAAVAAQSIALSLRGARKSDSLSVVRENMDFAVSIVERQLRNSRGITSTCNGSSMSVSGNPGIAFEDEEVLPATITCRNVGTNGYMQNDDGRLTSDQISITNCQFRCTQSSLAVPPVVTLTLSGSLKNASAAELSNITIEKIIRLRVY